MYEVVKDSLRGQLTKFGYVSLIKAEPSEINNVASELKGIEKRPSTGIEVLGAWSTFGAHDGVVIFTADTPQQAMEFLTRKISSISGIRATETLQGNPLPSYTPGSSAAESR